MVEQLSKLKSNIEQTIMDMEWTIFVNTLCSIHHHKSFIKARYVWANIRKDKFLDTCANFVHMVELVLMALRAFDGQKTHHGEGMTCHENIRTACLISLWN